MAPRRRVRHGHPSRRGADVRRGGDRAPASGSVARAHRHASQGGADRCRARV